MERDKKDHSVRLGLKLRTTDDGLLAEAVGLHRDGVFDYVELYVVPETYAETIDTWAGSGLPMVLHAPHSGHGVNLAQPELRGPNRRCYDEVKRFADRLESPIIIAHGGNNGSLEETAAQLAAISDPRLCLENKPAVGLDGEACVGSTPEEIGRILEAVDLKGFVLDFGHAAYAANAHKKPLPPFLGGFAAFHPKLFHLSDGLSTSVRDVHRNLFEGDFCLQDFLSLVPKEGRITLETPRRAHTGLSDFLRDVRSLRRLMRHPQPLVFLRKADFADASILLAWRNAPETRKASRVTGPVDPEAHRQWLRDTLRGNNRCLYVAMRGEIAVGTVRTDRCKDGLELSWTVAPGQTGKGIGKGMVALLARYIREPIRAEIRAGNVASVRIAESAGMALQFRQGEMLHFYRGPRKPVCSMNSAPGFEEVR